MLKYITKEIFELAPKEVQETFKDYFDGDLILVGTYYNAMGYEIYYKEKLDEFPALTEGDLRKFIEDKTGYKIELSYYGETGYDLSLTDGRTNYSTYVDLGQDLLQAYWIIACEIAKGEE